MTKCCSSHPVGRGGGFALLDKGVWWDWVQKRAQAERKKLWLPDRE